jgi:hypothetical protein
MEQSSGSKSQHHCHRRIFYSIEIPAMAYTFSEHKIIKVSPGKLTKYVNDKEADTIEDTARFSSLISSRNTVPGRFKMYLHQIKLSKHCMAYLKKEMKGDIFITIKWFIFKFSEFITSPENVDHNKTKFDFTAKYQVEVDEDFVNRINENPISFRLYARCGHADIFLSEAQLFISNIIEMVNVKQQHRVYFTGTASDLVGENIAYLDIWYKFTCKQKTLRSLFPDTKTDEKTATRMADLLNEQFSKKSQNFGFVHVSDSEFDHFADSVLLVLNRNKVLKTTQSDINTELQERVKWLRFEANWKQTLQENAILHGKNPEDVIWRQWREENTANVRLRTYDNLRPQTYRPEVIITVEKLFFLEGMSLLRNDAIRQFYVEYSFLGHEGPEMETPFSVAKANAEEPIVFNFKKIFPIDLHRNHNNCKLLAELIQRDDIIKFMVISEPVENFDKPIQTCTEIGYAEVPFNELIQLQDNVDSYEYDIIDFTNPIAILGYMTIKVEGILAMRKMALDLMAPKDYKLYM